MEQNDEDMGTNCQNDFLDVSMSEDESMHLHNNMVYTLLYKFVA